METRSAFHQILLNLLTFQEGITMMITKTGVAIALTAAVMFASGCATSGQTAQPGHAEQGASSSCHQTASCKGKSSCKCKHKNSNHKSCHKNTDGQQ